MMPVTGLATIVVGIAMKIRSSPGCLKDQFLWPLLPCRRTRQPRQSAQNKQNTAPSLSHCNRPAERIDLTKPLPTASDSGAADLGRIGHCLGGLDRSKWEKLLSSFNSRNNPDFLTS